MPSSISSSEPLVRAGRKPHYARAILLAGASLVLMLVVLEAGMRLTFNRVSRIGKRIAVEYNLAHSVAHGNSVLIVGNSLLLEGVDLPGLQKEMSPVQVARFVVENTSWLDWYYGIRRLLAEGSRPKVLLLCMNTPQLMSSNIRGDFSSFYLFQARDIPAVAREAHLNLTVASNLLFAHYSRFFADRANLRNFLLNRLDPSYVELMFAMTVKPPPPPSPAEIQSVAQRRLTALKAACEQSGVQCILLIPPGFIAGEKDITAAGTRAGVEVWTPIPQDALPHSDYKDDYHLNQHGAAIFTQALADALHRKLAYNRGIVDVHTSN